MFVKRRLKCLFFFSFNFYPLGDTHKARVYLNENDEEKNWMAVVKLHAEYLISNLIWIAILLCSFKVFVYPHLVHLLNLLASVSEWVSEEEEKVLNARLKLFHHKRAISRRENKSFLSSAHPFEWILLLLLMPLARGRINFVSCLSNWWRNGSSISID